MVTSDTGKHREATGFQEHSPYDESIDLRTDFVMVYGLDDTTPQRIARWREAGYRVHLMTGISWGNYQDYLDGRWAPRGVQVTTALRVPSEPAAVRAYDTDLADFRYDAELGVLWLHHPGAPTGTHIEITF